MRGLPLLCWSLVQPVCYYLFQRCEIVLWLLFSALPHFGSLSSQETADDDISTSMQGPTLAWQHCDFNVRMNEIKLCPYIRKMELTEKFHMKNISKFRDAKCYMHF